MENKTYPNYSSETEKFKAKRTKRTLIPKGVIVEAIATDIYEFRELIALAEAFDKGVTKKTISPLLSYNINSRIKELGETTIAKEPQAEVQVRPFIAMAEGAIAKAPEEANVEQVNSDFFNYYGLISDLKISSHTMVEIAEKWNANPNLETAWESTENSILIPESIKELFKDLKGRLEKVVDETGKIIGQAGQALKNALRNAGKWLNENMVPKFKEAYSKLMAIYDAFRLKLFESMFDFARKVTDLATKKGWKIAKITVGMPTLGLTMSSLGSFTLPIPDIKEPPVSFTFKPM